MEIDTTLADTARAALRATVGAVTVVTGDGAHGHLPGALYDRVIATVAVRVGELPTAWIAQTRPGGVIVTPVRTDSGGSVALVRFTVHDDGTATGQPIRRVGFMAVRTPQWSVDHLDPEDPGAEARGVGASPSENGFQP